MPPSTRYISGSIDRCNGKPHGKNEIKTTDILGIKQYKYDRKLNKTKRSARSELDIFEWSSRGFVNNNYWIDQSVDRVPRICVSQVSREEFIEKYEAPSVPIVITGCTEGWAAETKWNKEDLIKNYKSYKFKIGEDDEGNPVRMRLKYYMHYLDTEGQKEDSPLYIFDSSFGKLKSKTSPEDRKTSSKKRESLLKDYKVPPYFDDDLFRFTGDRRRPPYRWFMVGGERSGTGIHVDPLGTSAWNTLLVGHKRWCLFPPTVPHKQVDPPMGRKDHEAATWFTHVFPRLVRSVDGEKSLAEEYGMLEVLQRPGETVFVPGGWHHIVMNLDFTIAVTQNFCSPTSIEYVWLRTRNARPKLAQKLLWKLAKLADTSGGKNRHGQDFYKNLVGKIRKLETVPSLQESSSSNSSSSTSSSSKSSSTEVEDTEVSETESETDGSDGECRCHSCKMKSKRMARRQERQREWDHEGEKVEQQELLWERRDEESEGVGMHKKEKIDTEDYREKKRRRKM